MYKVNLNTKIGKAIKSIIEESPYKEAFHEVSLSFLTSEHEEHSKLNVHIYPENRLDRLKVNLGYYKENNVHIPGCIACSIIENYDRIPYMKGSLDIDVKFGSKAASSRVPTNTIREYPINSHRQLGELEFLQGDKVTLKHSLDTSRANTFICIKNTTIEVDTVMVTARAAIDAAIMLMYKKSKG